MLQALRCLLNGVPSDSDTKWTPEGVSLLQQLGEMTALKVKVVNESPLMVDLLSAADDKSLLPRLLENEHIWQRSVEIVRLTLEFTKNVQFTHKFAAVLSTSWFLVEALHCAEQINSERWVSSPVEGPPGLCRHQC